MRILHVAASLAARYGGPSKVCVELCQELARRGQQVAVYTTNLDGGRNLDVPLDRPFCNRGVEFRYFPVQLLRSYSLSIPLAKALQREIPGYDIVHIHSVWAFSTLVAAGYCRRYGVPYLIRTHGSLDPYLLSRRRCRKWIYGKLFERRNLDRAAAIHFTSELERELARPLALRAPAVVVPNGLDPAEYCRTMPESSQHARQGTIFFLGRLVPKKGLDLLVKAFARVVKRRRDAQLILAGPDDSGYARQLRKWLEAEGALGRTTFTGMLSGKEKLSALRCADIFALTSYDENFGMAVVEAMACALPVLISNKVAIWREVSEAAAGLVVSCEVSEVAEALEKLLDDPSLREEMGRRGRRLVQERFTWEVVGQQLMKVYRAISAAREHRDRHAAVSCRGDRPVEYNTQVYRPAPRVER